MNIHYFQHVPFEGPGSIESWASQKNYPLRSTQFYKNDLLPDLDGIDWLIVMGGPMSVHDEAAFPWLRKEKKFIEQAIEKGKVVIGICLGAQLIAEALGAKVYPAGHKEIGWWPVQTTSEARKNPLFHVFPQAFIPFHWHGETFDLPSGAIHIAETPACPVQAFNYKGHVTGLQFHMEATPASVDLMIEHGKKELISSDYIQTAEDIRMKTHLAEENNRLLGLFLNELLICDEGKALK